MVVRSSSAHRYGVIDLQDLNYTKSRKYDSWAAYGQSKLANLLHAQELNRRAEGDYIAVAVHPGAINNKLGRHLPAYQMAAFRMASKVPFILSYFMGQKMKTIPQGAATTIWAIVSDTLEGGEYCADCAVAEPHYR